MLVSSHAICKFDHWLRIFQWPWSRGRTMLRNIFSAKRLNMPHNPGGARQRIRCERTFNVSVVLLAIYAACDRVPPILHSFHRRTAAESHFQDRRPYARICPQLVRIIDFKVRQGLTECSRNLITLILSYFNTAKKTSTFRSPICGLRQTFIKILITKVLIKITNFLWCRKVQFYRLRNFRIFFSECNFCWKKTFSK